MGKSQQDRKFSKKGIIRAFVSPNGVGGYIEVTPSGKDDSQNIQEAINMLEGGGEIHLTQGEFYIKASLLVPQKVNLVMHGVVKQ